MEYASLKHFILELKDDYFKINYSFNYINNFIKEINLKKNIDNFYKYDKFSNWTFYEKLNPYYFEESCINAFKDINFLPSDFSHFLSVKTIVNLDEEENTYDRLNHDNIPLEMNKIEYYQMNIKTIEQIIQKYDLYRKDKENNIYYYLNKGLNSEKQKYISFINNKRNRNDVKIGEELEKK